MTEEQIKEQLSRHFVELVASRQGFKCSKPSPDSGVDMQITRAFLLDRNGRKRYLDSGQFIEFQLKCTCESQIIFADDSIRYDLEAKTYNDLIFRRDSGAITPLLLVLLVLPDDPNDWLQVTPQELILRRAAYWYAPPQGAEATENTSTIRIEIPSANGVGVSFIGDRFAEVYQ